MHSKKDKKYLISFLCTKYIYSQSFVLILLRFIEVLCKLNQKKWFLNFTRKSNYKKNSRIYLLFYYLFFYFGSWFSIMYSMYSAPLMVLPLLRYPRCSILNCRGEVIPHAAPKPKTAWRSVTI